MFIINNCYKEKMFILNFRNVSMKISFRRKQKIKVREKIVRMETQTELKATAKVQGHSNFTNNGQTTMFGVGFIYKKKYNRLKINTSHKPLNQL